jgi:hypothetical protein
MLNGYHNCFVTIFLGAVILWRENKFIDGKEWVF